MKILIHLVRLFGRNLPVSDQYGSSMETLFSPDRKTRAALLGRHLLANG